MKGILNSGSSYLSLSDMDDVIKYRLSIFTGSNNIRRMGHTEIGHDLYKSQPLDDVKTCHEYQSLEMEYNSTLDERTFTNRMTEIKTEDLFKPPN